MIFDKLYEDRKRTELECANRGVVKYTPPTTESLKAYVEKMWDDWELRGDGTLVWQLLSLKMISKEKAKEEFLDARLRRRLHSSKERLRCRSKKSGIETSSG